MRSLNPAFRILIALLLSGIASRATEAATELDFIGQPWTFTVGGGYSPVVGGLNSSLTSGWNFALGTEYNFTEKAGVRLEYQNNHLGVESGILNDYSARLGGTATDGNANVWSVTLNPTWRFAINRVVGAYLIGGGGYYHVKAQVTTPGLAYMPGYCDPFWGCWPGGVVPADFIVAEHKDDTGGVNAGFGIRLNLRSGVQFYMESRYHYVLLHGPDLQLFPFTAGFRF
jgi:opacity protein-like surface antigen